MRIAVVGLGSVGETCAHALVASNVVRRLVLVNRTVDVADAIARDLRQARAWDRRLETEVHSLEEPGVFGGCDLVILTLGPRLRGSQSRRDVATKALAMYEKSGLVDRLMEVTDDESPSVLVVTNPVEVATTWLPEKTGLHPRRVFGLGTTVESARLSQHLAALLDVDAASAWVHVLGEHGSGIVIPDQGRLTALEDPAKLSAFVGAARDRTLADAKTIRLISEGIGQRQADEVCLAWQSVGRRCLRMHGRGCETSSHRDSRRQQRASPLPRQSSRSLARSGMMRTA